MALPTVAIPKISGTSDATKYLAFVPSVGAIVVSALVLFFVTWPRLSEVLKLREVNQQLAKQVTVLAQKADKLESLDQTKLDQQLSAAEQLLPSAKDVFSTVRQVEALSGSSGVLLGHLEAAPGSVEQATGTTGTKSSSTAETGSQPTQPQNNSASDSNLAPKLPIKLTLTSDFKSLLQFLTRVLSLSRVVTLSDLGLTASSSGGSVQIKTALTVNAYWQQLPSQLPSIETAIEEIAPEEEAVLNKVQQGSIVAAPAPPSVPLGKVDLFAPF